MDGAEGKIERRLAEESLVVGEGKGGGAASIDEAQVAAADA